MEYKEHWMDEPEEHDYPAAEDYLSLLMTPGVRPRAHRSSASRGHPAPQGRGSAPGQPPALLGEDNVHVAKDLRKVREGHRLSPVLLVRGDLATDLPLIIADGYHRICASYQIDEDADIPCRIVDR